MPEWSIAKEKFIKDLVNRSKISKGYFSPRTIQTYERILNEAAQFLLKNGGVSLEVGKISTDNLIGFLSSVSDRKTSSSTINLYHSCLNSFFRFCVGKYKDLHNPMNGITRARNEHPETKCPTPEQIQNLLDYLRKDRKAKKRDEVLFELVIRTGPRVSEVCRLNLEDVSITDDLISVQYLGKGNKSRRIDIPCSAGEENNEVGKFKNKLLHYLSHYRRKWKVKPGNENAFFFSNQGKRISARRVESALQYYLKKLNLSGFTVHSLRHYFITNLLSKGVDVATVCRLVGHANPNVTYSIYAHSHPERLKEGILKAFS